MRMVLDVFIANGLAEGRSRKDATCGHWANMTDQTADSVGFIRGRTSWRSDYHVTYQPLVLAAVPLDLVYGGSRETIVDQAPPLPPHVLALSEVPAREQYRVATRSFPDAFQFESVGSTGRTGNTPASPRTVAPHRLRSVQ